jgi:UDPglucose--hexose-1-phosphate uridylyltransferase
MFMEAMREAPHRRYNALTGEWVLISPHRTKRPWQGKVESPAQEDRPTYDPHCYLCPGNKRASGAKNPQYLKTYSFANDFEALIADTINFSHKDNLLFQSESVQGTCRVICFSPYHNMTLPEMPVPDIRLVVDLWAEQVEELGKTYRWVQVFENKGEIMGCSNPHPHGQIWAGTALPNEPYKEDCRQAEYYEKHTSILLIDYLNQEIHLKERIILENEHWVVLTPFWAIWPFETMLLPKRHVQRIYDLTEDERNSLADILKRHLTKYDNLFNISFPYTMGWHGAPPAQEGQDQCHWQLHAHFYPPLLRSAAVKKFMVGYEMLAEPQRDITPEQAAERLRATTDIHYKVK